MKITKDTKVHFIVETGFAGSDHEEIMTLEDLGIDPNQDYESLERALDEESQEFMANYIGYGWSFVDG